MILRDLLCELNVSYDGINANEEIVRIETNFKNINKENANGTLFVCIRGSKYDTHSNIDELFEFGVTAIVAEFFNDNSGKVSKTATIKSENTRKALALLARAFYGYPDNSLIITGITGTKGKTTITYMLSEICRRQGEKCGIIGTNGAIFDGKTLETVNSTPGSLEFFSLLKQMAESGVRYVFCEVTSQALKQYRVFGVKFDIAVFTNFFPDHIGTDEHKSLDEYRECKSRLFEMCKVAILNGDDNEYEYFARKCSEFSVPYKAFYMPDKDENITRALRLPGAFNLQNALCARAVANTLGFSEQAIFSGIENVRVFGRCERVDNPRGLNIVIDYAHNKESLENILKTLRETCKGRLICVFGAGGDRSKLRRAGMGEAAAKYADFSVVTSDNPRNENPEKIIEGIISGMNDVSDNYIVIPDRKKAIFYALSVAEREDTVLLAGKGAQLFEERGGVKYRFDEREVVAEYYEKTHA